MKCVKPIYACGFDALLLNCGEAVEDGTPLLEVDNPLRVGLTPVYRDANAIELDDGKGRPCVDIPGCRFLSRIDIEIDLCGLSPAQVGFLTGGLITEDGVSWGRREECGDWFALRFWQDLGSSGRKLCNDDGEELNVVWWLPCTTNWSLSGDFEMANNVVTSGTLQGQAFANEGGFGPNQQGHWDEYALATDLDGNPAVLPDSEMMSMQCVPLAPPVSPDDCGLSPFTNGARAAEAPVAPVAPRAAVPVGAGASSSGSSSSDD